MFTLCVLLLTLISWSCGAFPGPPKPQINDRPIIGILTQETEDDNLKPYGKTYIPSSYVKYLESAGCRVTPVKLNLTLPEYEKIFNSINGMMFIGGAVNLLTSDFAKAAAVFYKLALKAYVSGDYFPLWGTCLGFQLLTALVAGDDLLTNATVENKALPLKLTAGAESSRMFRNFPPELMKSLSQEPLTGNFHHYGIATQTFEGNERLESFFSILSTNKAKEGVEFVSTIEAQPDSESLEGKADGPTSSCRGDFSRCPWKKISLLWSPVAPRARRSSHHFSSAKEEDAALIYNYSPLYVGNISSYMQIYFF
ncbi:gamma-glutamyl hydrolase-like isoform X3 [Acipenser ruthenus]|uniref:gamma-glutamyl hydrolase-like isoform X3 n=1 Tax=Acipenser ruthenus TaxID=7906 RepID=UPI002741B2C5|nr:gamma-glutamyl hydrolase-like isoform X3 [Acipenser ruthenus]